MKNDGNKPGAKSLGIGFFNLSEKEIITTDSEKVIRRFFKSFELILKVHVDNKRWEFIRVLFDTMQTFFEIASECQEQNLTWEEYKAIDRRDGEKL
ncbi:hypothetical protein ACFLZE_02975 [Thermodesulfobacteriota bacterium]